MGKEGTDRHLDGSHRQCSLGLKGQHRRAVKTEAISQGRAFWAHSKLAAALGQLKGRSAPRTGPASPFTLLLPHLSGPGPFWQAPNTAVAASAKFWPLHPQPPLPDPCWLCVCHLFLFSPGHELRLDTWIREGVEGSMVRRHSVKYWTEAECEGHRSWRRHG